MRVLVTGGLGFIGSATSRGMLANGHDVRILDSSLAGHGANARNVADLAGRVEIIEGDVRDLDVVRRALDGCDLIVHAAGHSSHTAGIEEPGLDLEHNVRGVVSLAEAWKECAPGARLLFLSTRGVYGAAQSIPAAEEAPCDPLGIYEWSKLAGESFLRTWTRLHDLRMTTLRLTNVYGPGSQLRSPEFGVINWFLGLALQGKDIPLFGEGRQRRDLIFIDDVVEAIVASANCAETVGEVYNVGSPVALSLKALCEAIVAAAGSGRIVFKPYSSNRRRTEVGDFASDVSKLERATGWRPKTSLDEGLRESIAYYRTCLDAYL